ncbi:MAG: YggT family protein [Desulfohalobiaceae bacterium]
MFILSNFLLAIAEILNALLSIYFWIIIISAILSWVNPDPFNPVVRILRNLTEPVLYRVRSWLPFTVVGGVDLSPIVVLLGIQFVKIFLVQSISQMAMGM